MNKVWCPDCFAVLASESGVEHWVIEEHVRRGCPAARRPTPPADPALAGDVG